VLSLYTIDSFKTPTHFFKSESLDLHRFALFFEEKIAYRRYTYVNSKGKVKKINKELRGENLPHLIGLQYWSNLPSKQASKQYKMLLDGTIDFEFLKASDITAFKNHKDRFKMLPFFYRSFYNYECEIKLVERNSNVGFERRKVDMIFRQNDSPDVYLLELRCKGVDKFTFVPSSITVHKFNSATLKAKYLPLYIQEMRVDFL